MPILKGQCKYRGYYLDVSDWDDNSQIEDLIDEYIDHPEVWNSTDLQSFLDAMLPDSYSVIVCCGHWVPLEEYCAECEHWEMVDYYHDVGRDK